MQLTKFLSFASFAFIFLPKQSISIAFGRPINLQLYQTLVLSIYWTQAKAKKNLLQYRITTDFYIYRVKVYVEHASATKPRLLNGVKNVA